MQKLKMNYRTAYMTPAGFELAMINLIDNAFTKRGGLG